MRYLLVILLFIGFNSYGQGRSSFGATRTLDTSFTKGRLKLEAYVGELDTALLVIKPNGDVVLMPKSRLNGGSGTVDSNVYVTITRLNDSLNIIKTLLAGKVDSVTKSNDTFYYWKLGAKIVAGVVTGSATPSYEQTLLVNNISLATPAIHRGSGNGLWFQNNAGTTIANVIWNESEQAVQVSTTNGTWLFRDDGSLYVGSKIELADVPNGDANDSLLVIQNNEVRKIAQVSVVQDTGFVRSVTTSDGLLNTGTAKYVNIIPDTVNKLGTKTDLNAKVNTSDTTKWVNGVIASNTVIIGGTAKFPVVNVDTGYIFTQSDAAGKLDTGSNYYIKNQTSTQQNAAFWTDSGFINTVVPFIQRKAIFYGDSRTSGFGLGNNQLRWPRLVSNRFGWTEDNRAVSGTTLEKRAPIDYSASPNMVDNAPTIPTYNADSHAYLIIAYGYNDVRYNGGSYDTTNFRTDYNTVLDAAIITKSWPANRIMLVDVWYNTPTSYTAVAGSGVATQLRHLSFNFVISSLAAQRGTLYYPAYDYMYNNIGSYGFQPGDSIHDNASSERIKAEGAIRILQYDLAKHNQQFAVRGTSEFTRIKYHPQDTVTGTFTALGLDSLENIVALPNKLVNINYTTRPQGGRIYMNGAIGSGGKTNMNTDVEDLQGVGLRATYGVIDGNYGGSQTTGSKMIFSFLSSAGRIQSYNHATSTALTTILNELGGSVLVNTTGNTAGAALKVGGSNGNIEANGLRVATQTSVFSTGSGIEINFVSNVGAIVPINRGTSTFLPLELYGTELRLRGTFGAGAAGTGQYLKRGTTGNNVVTVLSTIPVGDGGSGLTTTTPYAVFTGGTTATGNFQQVSGLGTSGQVLTSNGAGALPTWQTASGGGLSASNFAFNETPTGTINGVNTAFTLAFAPTSGKIQVWLNGLLQAPPYYSVVGTTLTMGTAPLTGDELLVFYIH